MFGTAYLFNPLLALRWSLFELKNYHWWWIKGVLHPNKHNDANLSLFLPRPTSELTNRAMAHTNTFSYHVTAIILQSFCDALKCMIFGKWNTFWSSEGLFHKGTDFSKTKCPDFWSLTQILVSTSLPHSSEQLVAFAVEIVKLTRWILIDLEVNCHDE